MKKTPINIFLAAIVLTNIFFAFQNHFLPSLTHFLPVLKYLSLSSWGLRHLLLFQPISFSLIHYTSILDIQYLSSLLFYIYILKKCGDHFSNYGKEKLFILLYVAPTAISALLYGFALKGSIHPLFSPYLSLTSIVLSCAILTPNMKILKPVHSKPAHYGIPLKWVSLVFLGYHLALGSLSSRPNIDLCIINIIITYILAYCTLKARSRLYLLKKIEKFLHNDISLKKRNSSPRIDRILDKIAKHGMKSLSFLDRLYLRINKTHIS